MKSIKIILYILFINNLINAQITFEKTYGGSGHQFGNSVIQTKDNNGYLLLGSSESFSNSRDVYLIKTNLYGDTLWSKVYGGISGANGIKVIETLDSGFVFLNYLNNQTNVTKINSLGNTIWTKNYIGNGRSIIQTSDSGYAIVGDIYSTNLNYNILLIKADVNGDTIWTKNYGTYAGESGLDLQQTNDSGYIIAGNNFQNSDDVYLIKTNPQGDTTWTKSFIPHTPGTVPSSIIQTTDNGYIISNSLNSDKIQIIKTDINGDTIWKTNYDYFTANQDGCKILQTSDGGYAFIGETNFFEVCLIKTNNIGDTLWHKSFKKGFSMDFQITNDGGYIIIGSTQKILTGINDIYLVKTNDEGVVIGIKEQLKSNNKLNIFPNPTKNSITISQTEPTFNKYEIYSLNGKLVAENKINNILQKVDLTGYAEGMYIVKLIGTQKVEFKKIVVVE